CIRDQWPAAFRQCLAAVKDEADAVACRMRHMPADYQQSRTDTRLRISGIEPAQGNATGGSFVRIKGNRFMVDGPRTAKVYFGGKEGSFVRFEGDRELIVQAPGGKGGEVVDVQVVFDPGGMMTL